MSKNNLPLSYIEISKKNLIWNIKQIRGLVKKPARNASRNDTGGGTKISAVVKGNAYGHGQNEVAQVLEPYVDYFQVNSIEELALLRKVSKKKTLLLGYVQKADLVQVVKLRAVLSFFTMTELLEINKIAGNTGVVQEVHMPIDAELGREGFLPGDWVTIFMAIKKCKHIKLSGMYAHFANIEDTKDFSHAQKQIEIYERAVKSAEDFGFKDLETHISATSGILVYEKGGGIHSIVRSGIGLYGMWPSEEIEKMYQDKISLKPVITWKTKIAQVKTLPKGHSIGYGLTFITPKEMTVALIPQGYSNGLDRRMSSNGSVLISGTRCPILGRMAMNMFVVDVSHLKNVAPENEVVILGIQKGGKITAEEISENIGTIAYEVTTTISPLLPRIIV